MILLLQDKKDQKTQKIKKMRNLNTLFFQILPPVPEYFPFLPLTGRKGIFISQLIFWFNDSKDPKDLKDSKILKYPHLDL